MWSVCGWDCPKNRWILPPPPNQMIGTGILNRICIIIIHFHHYNPCIPLSKPMPLSHKLYHGSAQYTSLDYVNSSCFLLIGFFTLLQWKYHQCCIAYRKQHVYTCIHLRIENDKYSWVYGISKINELVKWKVIDSQQWNWTFVLSLCRLCHINPCHTITPSFILFYYMLLLFKDYLLSAGHVHITDFNIATLTTDNQLATSMSGTTPYMGKCGKNEKSHFCWFKHDTWLSDIFVCPLCEN